MQKIPTHMKCDVLLTTYNSPFLNSFLPSIPSHPVPSPFLPALLSLSLSPPAIPQPSNNPPGSPGRGTSLHTNFSYSTSQLTSREKEKIKTDPKKEKLKSRRKKFQYLFFLASHPYSDTLTHPKTPKHIFRVPRFFWRVK